MARRKKKGYEPDFSLTSAAKYGTYLGFIRLLAWVNLPFVAFLTFMCWMSEGLEFRVFFLWFWGMSTFITIFCLVLSFFKSLVRRYQILGYLLISVESFILIMWFDATGLVMFAQDEGTSERLISDNVDSFILPLFILFVLAMIGFYFYQRNESVRKLNDYYYGGKLGIKRSSIGAIVGGIVLFKLLFQENASIETFSMLLVPFLLTAVLPVAIMGGIFSAVYTYKHPECRALTELLT